MTRCTLLFALILLPAVSFALVTQPELTPAAPEIKSLFQDEMRRHPSGHGAECGREAGTPLFLTPKTVLELWEELDLSADQLARTKEIHDEMSREAKRLGGEISAREQAVDTLLGRERPDLKELRSLLLDSGGLQAELRLVHLKAGLRMKELLTPAQLKKFQELQRRKAHGDPHHH